MKGLRVRYIPNLLVVTFQSSFYEFIMLKTSELIVTVEPHHYSPAQTIVT